ncbi:hypothetical protein C1701_10675 [Actinoalloteichus sp. AHMU CJ021]|nr:hypothetical protein C1701_10675 [Actinoalloteichus sp. AHMU CJ021]
MRGEDAAAHHARSLFSDWTDDEGPPLRTEAKDVVLRGHRVLRRRRAWRIAGSAAGSALVLVGAFTLVTELGPVPGGVPGGGFTPSGVAPPPPTEPPSSDHHGTAPPCPIPGIGPEQGLAASPGEATPPAAPDHSAFPAPPPQVDRPDAEGRLDPVDGNCAGSP